MAYPRLQARFFVSPSGDVRERVRRDLTEEERVRVWTRDLGRCQACGRPVTKRRPRGYYDHHHGEVDHILPTSRGGTHDSANLRLVCATLNRSRKADARNERARCDS